MDKLIQVRMYQTLVEEVFHENGPAPAEPRLRGACLAVIKNPYAGTYQEDLMPFMKALEPLGLEMSKRLIAALGGDTGRIDGYGKAALVGEDGELELAALWHAPGGYAMREHLGDAKAIVPSTKKVGGPGTRLDVPIAHANAAYVRSHFDAIEVGLNDAPRRDEILYALAMAIGPRVHSRAGGLTVDQVKGEDGLR